MEKWWQLNKILWKQYLVRNKIWLAVLCVVGILAICFGTKSGTEEYNGIKVGVLAEDENGKLLLKKLREEEGIFRFLAFDEREEMIREIENGTLECGFVLPEKFFENIAKGKMMRQIELYYSPSSTAHKISYEVAFSYLFQELSDHVLLSYIDDSVEKGVFTAEEAGQVKDKLLVMKEKYSNNGSTFSFSYEQVGSAGEREGASFSMVRGCIAVLVFFLSLLGLSGCLEVNELSKGLNRKNRIKVRECSLNISIFASVLFGGILLALWGQGESFFIELKALCVYFIVLQIYIRCLKLFIKKPETVYGLTPVLVLGSLLLCPVFIRIETYLPATSLLQKLFPASYYLNLF